jgi:hypothetical protein
MAFIFAAAAAAGIPSNRIVKMYFVFEIIELSGVWSLNLELQLLIICK